MSKDDKDRDEFTEADDNNDKNGLTTPITAPSRSGDVRRRDPGGEEGRPTTPRTEVGLTMPR
ncbi:hypothetical protein AHAS_Ahas01G0117800 [Arachis hypogaea]